MRIESGDVSQTIVTPLADTLAVQQRLLMADFMKLIGGQTLLHVYDQCIMGLAIFTVENSEIPFI
jgi:hypothetical protein